MAPCDRQRVFLYGWSEGTAVAAALATQRQDIDGLVLQGPCGLPYRAMVQSWIEDVGLPYAQGADGGAVTNADLAAAQTGPGGMVAKLAVSFFVDPASLRTGKPVVSTLLDQNGDGQLDPETEIRAALPDLLDFAFSPQGNCYIYAEGRTVPTVTEQAPKLPMPVLILQGEHDASTPRRAGVALHAALVAAGNRAATLMLLPGLGHTLGPCPSVLEDAGQAPAEATLVPIAGVVARAGGRVGCGGSGGGGGGRPGAQIFAGDVAEWAGPAKGSRDDPPHPLERVRPGSRSRAAAGCERGLPALPRARRPRRHRRPVRPRRPAAAPHGPASRRRRADRGRPRAGDVPRGAATGHVPAGRLMCCRG